MLKLAEETGSLHAWIEQAALAMGVFAILVILVGLIYSAARYVMALLQRSNNQATYNSFKASMGRTLLLGLEILVAADVVRTVALEPTRESVIVLALLVLIRTFLSWSLVVEIEGRWPWQKEREPSSAAAE